MLTLYHGDTSVCSVKVRIGLAEKGLSWQSEILNLKQGDQHAPDYLKINPNGVVPTLVDDGFIVMESSAILEYVDQLTDDDQLMPLDKKGAAISKMWLIRTLDIHAAINTMTFSTVGRIGILKKSKADIEASLAKMPSPAAAKKRRDLIEKGIESDYLHDAFYTLKRTFSDMQSALEMKDWLAGSNYSMADIAIIAYIDRLEKIGMAGMWDKDYSKIGDWLARARQRYSYAAALDPFIDKQAAQKMREQGDCIWPDLSKKWFTFLTD